MAAGTEQGRKPGFTIFRFMVIIVLLLIILFFLFGTDQLWRWIYPLEYENLIIENAYRFELDPYLLAAIIYVESRFDPEARSPKGALGLMQIMPDTGRWIASELDNEDFEKESLYQPERNILYGSWYLDSLKKQFSDQRTVVLSAYNAGRGNVSNWLQGKWDGKAETISDLPFAETRDFVERVERTYKIYKRIYTNELQD